MEKEFVEFLSEELLDFCSYGSRENNLAFNATNRCEELDALTKLTSKEVGEYLTQHNDDYCSNSETNALSIKLSQGPSHTIIIASLVENLPRPRAIMKLRKHVKLEYQLRHE